MTDSADAADSTTLPPIHLTTLNCWGLKYLSASRHERLAAIGHALLAQSPRPTIVALQELWTFADYRAIRAITRARLPHAHFYSAGIFGAGLALLSAYPITRTSATAYALNGRPAAVHRGDWYVGKGVAAACVRLGPGRAGLLDVFVTHLHAPYVPEPADDYLCHRTAQAWQLAGLVADARERGHAVAVMGDFNMRPASVAYRIMVRRNGVRDVWGEAHPEAVRDGGAGRLGFNLEVMGMTCDSVANTWRWTEGERKRLRRGVRRVVGMETEDPLAKRLDYIFWGDGRVGWRVERVEVGMRGECPGLGCSLSDHFSVEATMCPVTAADRGSAAEDWASTAKSKDEVDSDAQLVQEILELVRAYTLTARRERRMYLSCFPAGVLLAVGCWVGIWLARHPGVAFLLAVVSTLGLGAGIVAGLIGGLFGGQELRALWEFEGEVRRWGRDSGNEREAGEGDAVKDWWD
jgi:sphingomyelin phosphodiesterase 2